MSETLLGPDDPTPEDLQKEDAIRHDPAAALRRMLDHRGPVTPQMERRAKTIEELDLDLEREQDKLPAADMTNRRIEKLLQELSYHREVLREEQEATVDRVREAIIKTRLVRLGDVPTRAVQAVDAERARVKAERDALDEELRGLEDRIRFLEDRERAGTLRESGQTQLRVLHAKHDRLMELCTELLQLNSDRIRARRG